MLHQLLKLAAYPPHSSAANHRRSTTDIDHNNTHVVVSHTPTWGLLPSVKVPQQPPRTSIPSERHVVQGVKKKKSPSPPVDSGPAISAAASVHTGSHRGSNRKLDTQSKARAPAGSDRETGQAEQPINTGRANNQAELPVHSNRQGSHTKAHRHASSAGGTSQAEQSMHNSRQDSPASAVSNRRESSQAEEPLRNVAATAHSRKAVSALDTAHQMVDMPSSAAAPQQTARPPKQTEVQAKKATAKPGNQAKAVRGVSPPADQAGPKVTKRGDQAKAVRGVSPPGDQTGPKVTRAVPAVAPGKRTRESSPPVDPKLSQNHHQADQKAATATNAPALKRIRKGSPPLPPSAESVTALPVVLPEVKQQAEQPLTGVQSSAQAPPAASLQARQAPTALTAETSTAPSATAASVQGKNSVSAKARVEAKADEPVAAAPPASTAKPRQATAGTAGPKQATAAPAVYPNAVSAQPQAKHDTVAHALAQANVPVASTEPKSAVPASVKTPASPLAAPPTAESAQMSKQTMPALVTASQVASQSDGKTPDGTAELAPGMSMNKKLAIDLSSAVNREQQAAAVHQVTVDAAPTAPTVAGSYKLQPTVIGMAAGNDATAVAGNDKLQTAVTGKAEDNNVLEAGTMQPAAALEEAGPQSRHVQETMPQAAVAAAAATAAKSAAKPTPQLPAVSNPKEDTVMTDVGHGKTAGSDILPTVAAKPPAVPLTPHALLPAKAEQVQSPATLPKAVSAPHIKATPSPTDTSPAVITSASKPAASDTAPKSDALGASKAVNTARSAPNMAVKSQTINTGKSAPDMAVKGANAVPAASGHDQPAEAARLGSLAKDASGNAGKVAKAATGNAASASPAATKEVCERYCVHPVCLNRPCACAALLTQAFLL